MLRLYVTPDGQQPYLLSFERAHISIGSAAENDVRLQGQGISGRHFVLRRVGVDVVLDDCNSRNGTYVNRSKVTSPQVLGADDVIQIVGFQIRLVADAKPKARPDTVQVAAPAATGGASAPRQAPAVVAPALAALQGAGRADGPGAGSGGGRAPAGAPSVGKAASAAVQEPAAVEPASALGAVVELPPGFDCGRVATLVVPRAQAWHERADDALLLRGDELHEAQLWAQSGGRVQPAPTRRELSFVAASVQAGRRAGRRRWQIAGTWLLSLVIGGWTAGRVLAGGPEAYSPGLSRWGVEQFQERLTAARIKRCREVSTLAAAAAQAKAQQAPEEGLSQATEALRCVTEFSDIGTTEAERVVRGLLGTSKSFVLERGDAAVRWVTGEPQGRVVAWGRGDGTVVVWDVARWVGKPQEGDGSALRLLSTSADGSRLVAVSESGLVRVWDLGDEAAAPQRLVLDLVRDDVGVAALSADGRRLAIASASQPDVRAFDLDSAAAQIPAIRLAGLGAPAERVIVNADGTRVFAASGAQLLGWRLGLNRALGKPQVFAGHVAGVTTLSLLTCPGVQGEKWLASGDASGEVQLWELRGRGRMALSGVEFGVRAVRATAGCRELVAAGLRGLRVWDLQLKEPGQTPRTIQLGTPIQAIEVDRGRVLAAAGTKIHACELATGTCEEYAGHTQTIAAMSPPGSSGWVITGGDDMTARLWDVRASAGIQSVQGHHEVPIRALAAGSDGRVLVASGPDAKLWRVEGVQPPRVLQTLAGTRSHPLRAVALSPSGLWAATAADTSELMLWQISDERAAPSPNPVPTQGPLLFVGFSEDGAWLIGSGDGATCAIDMRQAGQFRCVPFGSGGEVFAQVVIPGTHRVAVGTDDRDVKIVDLEAVTRADVSTQSLGKGKGVVRHLAVSADGRWLAALGENADGRLWDLRAPGSAAIELGALGAGVKAVAQFSHDRQWLVVGTGTKLLAWKLARPDSTPTVVRDKLDSSVTALAFGADRKTLLAGMADGTVLTWDFAALAEASPMTLGKHRENVVQIAVVDDGSVAVSVGRDTTMHVWPLTPRRLWQLAERVRGGRGR